MNATSVRASRPFSRLAGHPALDLLNTRPLGSEAPVERLTDLRALAAWCVQFGLVTPAEARRCARSDDRTVLAQVRSLREGLRNALEREAAGEGGWRSFVNRLNTALNRGRLRPTLHVADNGFEFTFERTVSAPGDLLYPIASEIADFLSGPLRPHARKCEAHDCVLWFADTTRNHTRTWCSMDGCGSRAKARAYYRRTKSKRRRARDDA